MTDRNETTVLSRHATSEGIVTYVRDGDGNLQVWLHPRPPRAKRLYEAPRGRAPASDAPDRRACA